MNNLRVAVALAALFFAPLAFASLPPASPRPVRPTWQTAAVLGPLLTLQQQDQTTGQSIFALKKFDGTTVALIDIAGDGTFLGMVKVGEYTTVNLPAVTTADTGRIVYDTTADTLKRVNNAGTWTALAGSGTVTGTGTNHNVAVWSGTSSLGTGLLTDDGAHQVQISAMPTAATNSSLFAVGAEPVFGSGVGNYFTINSVSPFLGDLMEVENNGVSEFTVDHNGLIRSASLTPNSFLVADGSKNIASGTSTDFTTSGTTLNLNVQGGFTAGTFVNPSVSVNNKGIITGIANGATSGVTGSGTNNTVAKFGPTGGAVQNSGITDDGTTVTNTENTRLSGALAAQLVKKTTTYTLANETVALGDATGGAFAVNLPTAATQTGRLYTVKKTDASGNAVTITPNGGDLIDGAASLILVNRYDFATLISDGTNWYVTAKQVVPLTVASGGTGQISNTAHGVLVGNAASPIAATAVGTTGQVLNGNTGADPTWGAVPGLGSYLPLAGGTMAGTINSQSITPTANDTYNIGATGNRYLSVHGGTFYTTSDDGVLLDGLPSANDTTLRAITGNLSLETSQVNGYVRIRTGTGLSKITVATGTPNGSVTGSVGDLFISNTGSATNQIWVKQSGAATNTGWLPLPISQTGTTSLSAATSVAVTFPLAFASAPTSVVVMPTATPGIALFWVTAITTTGFTLNSTASITDTFVYTATQ